MAQDKISIKLLKNEKAKIKEKLDDLLVKTGELEEQVAYNQEEITRLQAEKNQIQADIDLLKGE